jgi:membrane associated rhomboid family serine protease
VTRDGKAYPPPSSADDPTGRAPDLQLDAVADEDVDGEYGPTRAGLLAALALAGAPFLTGFRADNGRWFLAGEGISAKMLAGQQWRAVTALFLHADRVHLAGNVAATAALGTAVCRLLGPGIGLLLIVTSGAVGNLMNAYLRTGTHTSIGASIAIFGAVGILAGVATMRSHLPSRRPWVTIAAGLAVLGLLALGEHVDIAAHFFGLETGFGLGLATAVLADEAPGPRAQRSYVIATIAVVVTSWWLAVRAIGR